MAQSRSAAEAKSLTNGQLYDEANAIIWLRLRDRELSPAHQARLTELEAEFASRTVEAA